MNLEQEEGTKLLQCIFDYKSIDIGKQDFVKRKRVKTELLVDDRCIAKRACDEQCSRKKKMSSEFCGTHVKGLPYGTIHEEKVISVPSIKKVEIWIEDIKGIAYYLDNENNVYQTEDIIRNIHNPRVIAKYTKIGDSYSIPEFSI